MPSWAACAPAASTSSSPARSITPPAASSGSPTAARTRASSSAVVPGRLSAGTGIVRRSARLERRAVATGAPVLHHQRIDALPGGLERLVHRCDRGEHGGARPLQRPDNFGPGQPEGKTDQFHRIGQQRVDLALPVVVVVEPQRRDLHAVPQGIRPQPGAVVLQLRPHLCRRWQLGGIGNEDVHAETCPGGPGAADLRLHGIHALIARGQEAQAAGVVHGRHEGGSGGPARHRCGNNAGVKDVVRHCSLLERIQ